MSDPTADMSPAPVKLGWIEYLKLLYKGRPAVEDAINQGKMVANAAHTSGVKTLTFWMTVAGAIGGIAAQFGGLIPPPYGAIVLASSSFFYALSRGITKHGDELGGAKPALATSEVWVNAIAALGQVGLAAGHAVDPQTASILMAVSGAAISLSQGLAKGGAQPDSTVVAAPVDPEKP
jgi:hypothetical protein